MNKVHVKTGDTVIVLSGKDKGKKGKVLSVLPAERKVIVDGVNIVSRHTKPRKQGQPGGIIKKEAPFYACKVMNVCQKCSKPTRVKVRIDESGKRSKVCKHCGVSL